MRHAILASGTIRCPTVAGSYMVKSKAAMYLLFFAYMVSLYANNFIIGHTMGLLTLYKPSEVVQCSLSLHN